MIKSSFNRFLVLLVGLLTMCVTQVWAEDPTVTLTTSSSTSTSSVVVSPVTFSFTNGSTKTTWYDDGLRFYEGATITISSESNITKIIFTHGVSNNGCLNLTSGGGIYDASTKTWTGTSKSIVFTVGHSSGTKNGQVRLTEAVVSYATAAPAVPYSVTLNMNGAPYGDVLSEVSAGAGVTLPSVEDCGDYTFKGWSKTNTNGTSAQPTIYEAGSYSPSSNDTLYAVFSKTTGRSSTVTGSNLSGTTTATKLHTDHPITYKISSANNYSNPLRVYANNVVTIAGGTMSRIVFNVASDYDAAKLILQSGGGSISNGVWTGSSSSVQIKADGVQVRVSSISVTYGETTTTYTSSPDCGPATYTASVAGGLENGSII